jgi:hypothetical protein
VILGFEAGTLAETPGHALHAAAGFLPPPFDSLATHALTAVLSGGAIGMGARRARRREDELFDEGVQRGAGAPPPQPPPVAPHDPSPSRRGAGAGQ